MLPASCYTPAMCEYIFRQAERSMKSPWKGIYSPVLCGCIFRSILLVRHEMSTLGMGFLGEGEGEREEETQRTGVVDSSSDRSRATE